MAEARHFAEDGMIGGNWSVRRSLRVPIFWSRNGSPTIVPTVRRGLSDE